MTYLINNIYSDLSLNASLVLEDGTVFSGFGIGATGQVFGELCFNTSMTGYQEILSDPSYAGQIITFTFPHIGNVGTNAADWETDTSRARGLVLKEPITTPSNWRNEQPFEDWLIDQGLIGIWGIDTRALTALLREKGAMKATITHSISGTEINNKQAHNIARDWGGLNGLDLAKDVTCDAPYTWNEYGEFHVVAIDFGAKHNILRCLEQQGCKVTVVPATTSAANVLKYSPDGVFLSNGPGDPVATGRYAIQTVKDLIASNTPIFGICLGHQLLSLALGCTTKKMHLGHRGANHPVKNLETGMVEITSQNHGFMVERNTLPDDVIETHVSLFDDTNEGIKHKTLPVFSVQYHPESSPGPHDSKYLFETFITLMREHRHVEPLKKAI